jgi:hypothetical protein
MCPHTTIYVSICSYSAKDVNNRYGDLIVEGGAENDAGFAGGEGGHPLGAGWGWGGGCLINVFEVADAPPALVSQV